MPVPGRPGRSATSRPAAWPRNQVPGTLDETVIQLELETGKYALPVGFFSRLLGTLAQPGHSVKLSAPTLT